MTPRRELDADAVKRQVIELAKARYTPAEIATMVPGGYKVRTLRKWIRESGEVPSNEALAWEMWKDGADSGEIAARLRIGERGTYKLLIKVRGKKRDRNTVRQNVQRFLADSESMKRKPFVRSGPFGRELISECARLSRTPDRALCAIEDSIDLFAYIHATAIKFDRREAAMCRHTQVRGIKAHVLVHQSQEDLAVALLRENLLRATTRCCRACEADTLRRLAVVHNELEDWAKAEKEIEEALALYRLLPDCGHDLYGSGLGSCYLARTAIRADSTGSEAAIRDAETGLRLVMPSGQSERLYGMLVFALAAAMAKAGHFNADSVARGRVLLGEAKAILDPAKISITGIKIMWLDGLLAAIEGNQADALELLTDARHHATLLKAERETVALTADITRLDPDPGVAQAQILDLCEATEEGRLYLPAWLRTEALRDVLCEAQLAATKAIRQSRQQLEESVIRGLRTASGAAQLMPDLLGVACAA